MPPQTEFALGWAHEHEAAAKEAWQAAGTRPLYTSAVFADDVRPLPPSFTLASLVLWWHNQGGVGSCFCNASVGAIQTGTAAAVVAGASFEAAALSRWFQWFEGRRRDGISFFDGGTISGVMRAAAESGIPRESAAPYRASSSYLNRRPPEAAYAEAPQNRITGLLEFRAADIEGRKRAIFNGHPVVGGMWWPRGWDRGQVDKFGRTVGIGGGSFGHALYDVGWYTDADGHLYWHRVNSHGPIYGVLPKDLAATIPGYATARPRTCYSFWVRDDHDQEVFGYGGAELIAPAGIDGFKVREITPWANAAA